jgi:hypothetical protein
VAILLEAGLDVWRREFGDPDPLSWLITAAYIAASVLCARTALAAHRTGAGDAIPEQPRNWWLLSAGLLGLGLNKQLDLQILVREAGIAFIAFLGIDRHRKWVGRLFVLVMAIVLLRVLAHAARHTRQSTRGHGLLLTGLGLLACFAVVRAGTYVPGFKQFNVRYHDAIHFVFELGGVLLVGLSGWRTRQRLVRHHSSSINSA